MTNTIPKPQLIIGSREFFGTEPPENKLEIIKDVCRNNLIAEVCRLNYRLKPQGAKFTDTSFETQKEELLYFCGESQELAEVKSTGIYDKEKYCGNLDEFYKEGREKFFDAFGLTQLLNAINNLPETAEQFDSSFPKSKRIKLFPALIVNEKALQTPLMAQVFNGRFQELLGKIDRRQM